MRHLFTGLVIVALAVTVSTPAPAPLGPHWTKRGENATIPQPNPDTHRRCKAGMVWGPKVHHCVVRRNAMSTTPQPEPGAHLPQPDPTSKTQ
jgi:hypothetical protein